MALFSIIISFGYYYKLIFLSFSLFLSHSLSRSLRGWKKTLKINIMPIEIKRLKIENDYYRPHDSGIALKIASIKDHSSPFTLSRLICDHVTILAPPPNTPLTAF